MKTEIKLSDGSTRLLFIEELDMSINMDDLTKIDYNAIQAECITIPVLLNRVGIWLADQEHITSKAKLNRDIVKARREEFHRADQMKKGGKKPTGAQIDALVALDKEANKAILDYLEECKNEAVLKSLHEAVKDKSSHLKRLNGDTKLTPKEFENELLLNKINGVLLTKQKK